MKDTFADKVVLFALGAILGAVTGCRYAMRLRSQVQEASELVTYMGIGALAVGLLAVVGGTVFLERFIGRRD